MSVLSFSLVRSTKISSVITASVAKRSCSFLVWKKELGSLRSTYNDRNPVFTVPRRTLIKKRQLIGNLGSSHLKADYKKDQVGKEFEFIYGSSNIRLYYWWTPMIFIVITTILVLCSKVILDTHWSGKELENVGLEHEWLDSINPLTLAYCVSVIMLCLLVAVIRKLGTVLLRLYHNKSTNEFVAVMLRYGIYRKKMHFKANDVVRMDKFQLRGNVLIKGIPFSVSESNFTSTPAYNLFMGYSASRPSALKEQEDRENIAKTLNAIKDRLEKKHTDEFLEKYKEKRKQKQLKDR